MGHSGPRLLGIFPASFGALNPILPSTGGEAGAAHASHLTATLTSCPHSEWQGWASQAPWVARSAVREGGSGRDRQAGETAGSRRSSGVAAARRGDGGRDDRIRAGCWDGGRAVTEPMVRVRAALNRRWGMIEGRLGRD